MLALLATLGLGLVTFVGVNVHVHRVGRAAIVSPDKTPEAQAILVLGAYVYEGGAVSGVLRDRLLMGLQLYQQGVAPKIIVSGDHGQRDYDEVNAMREFLEQRGVPPEDVFLDHAGFDTYDSMIRARDVFLVDSLVVVTQEFHLIRALYIARSLGLNAVGVASDLSVYPSESYLRKRELLARIKAFLEVNLERQPVYGGAPIPIRGDGRQTHDESR